MFSKKERVLALLTAAEKEMSLLAEMSKGISCPTNMATWMQKASSIP